MTCNEDTQKIYVSRVLCVAVCCPFCVACLVLQGAALWIILAAGEWRSPAFLAYMDLHQLETDLVVQAHVNDSDSGEES